MTRALRSAMVLGGIAALVGAWPRAGEAASTLVEAAKNKDTTTALALLKKGAAVDERSPDGSTALLWAVHNDDVALVERLLAAGANAGGANDYGATPMSEAATIGNVEIIAGLLKAGADPDSPNADGQTALMLVARSSNIEAADALIRHGANVNAREGRKGQTALMWATAQSQPAMVKTLLEHGADVDARSTVHQWERYVTAEPRMKNMPSGGFTPLLYAARQGCLECARLLVRAGAKVDLEDPDGVTPLLSALLNAHFDTARYLLEAGANPNKWDWWGRTPLYAAVDYSTVPHGGRPDHLSLDETTSLKMIEILLAAGANPNAQLKLFPPYRSLRMDRGADSILDIGSTPLLRAARASDLDAMHVLIEHGALVDLPQVGGVTPLMAAAGLGASSIDTRGKFRTEPEAIAAATLLIDAGADVNGHDERGRTALHAAAAQGYTDLVKFLAAHGADLTAKDADGVTPLGAASGKMRGRGRNPTGEKHEETAAALEQLLTDAGGR